jgi:hypothetical protein
MFLRNADGSLLPAKFFGVAILARFFSGMRRQVDVFSFARN